MFAYAPTKTKPSTGGNFYAGVSLSVLLGLSRHLSHHHSITVCLHYLRSWMNEQGLKGECGTSSWDLYLADTTTHCSFIVGGGCVCQQQYISSKWQIYFNSDKNDMSNFHWQKKKKKIDSITLLLIIILLEWPIWPKLLWRNSNKAVLANKQSKYNIMAKAQKKVIINDILLNWSCILKQYHSK